MGPTSEEDDTPMELARFEGIYKDGQKTGFGSMVYPTGDTYVGEWFENKVMSCYVFPIMSMDHIILNLMLSNCTSDAR
jgi:hypothetical protein